MLPRMTSAILKLWIAILITTGIACQLGPAGLIEPASAPPGAQSPDTPLVIRSREVRIAVARIPDATTLTIPTFDAETLLVVRDRTTRIGRGLYWHGRIVGQPGSTVALVVNGEVLAGTIQTQRGQLYQFRYLGGGIHRFQQLDPSRFPPEGGSKEESARREEPAGDVCSTDPPTDIDVLVIYTDDTRVAAGGRDAIEADVYLALELTNQSYLNSNITQRLRLAHIAEVDYAETGDAPTDRAALESTTDNVLDNVHALRNTHAADLVVLITETSNWCGWAITMGSVGNSFNPRAFSVVMHYCAANNYSFAHELGHNMSARHDWVSDPTNNSPYAFNHGHFVTAPTDPAVSPWRTIMAYADACGATGCSRILFWSNPFISYPVGAAITDPMGRSTGTQQTDNHQTLENTALTIANFRCSSPTPANVWMKDTWNDTGKEPDPNTASEQMWRSPYIWVRNTQDVNLTHQHQHQDPEFGSSNWVYVKLHNGSATSGSGTLEIYYANASTALTWPSAWTRMGSISVPDLAAHGTRVVEQAWNSVPGTGHYCLLARWVSASDPMTIVEGSSIGPNVRNNNNLVWRNVNVVDLTSPDAADEVSVVVGNPDAMRPMRISLLLGWQRNERQPSFLEIGDVSLRLDDSLTAAWNRGGKRGSGYVPVRNALRIAKDGARLDGLLLQPGAQGRVYIKMQRLPTSPRRTYWIELVQVVEGIPLGGVTYEIHTDRLP